MLARKEEEKGTIIEKESAKCKSYIRKIWQKRIAKTKCIDDKKKSSLLIEVLL